jgi:hypothetical protein
VRGFPACVLVFFAAGLAAVVPGCGADRSATQTAASPAPSPSPSVSVSVDAQATTHVFLDQGFSLAYGPDWRAEFPHGRVWSAKDPPPAQPAHWSMLLVGYSAGRASSQRPEVVVAVRRNNGALEPAAFQRDAIKTLNAENPYVATLGKANVHHMFRPTSVLGVPALMAAFRDTTRSPALEEERYVFGECGIVYDIAIRAPVAAWPTDAATMRGIVRSLTLPGG